MISSNKFFLLSLPMKFFGQDQRFRQFAHWPPQAPAFCSQVQVGLLFSHAVTMLQGPFSALDELARFEFSLHFYSLGKQAGVLQGQSRLSGHRRGATDLPVSYTHLRAHETPEHLVCRLLLEKKK